MGHTNANWENQGGWFRCYCPVCHNFAQASKQEHRKWQRKVRTHAVRAKDAAAQHSTTVKSTAYGESAPDVA